MLKNVVTFSKRKKKSANGARKHIFIKRENNIIFLVHWQTFFFFLSENSFSFYQFLETKT